MEIVEISSFSEYVDFVEQISPQYSLSRGQEKDKDLLPSILRKNEGRRKFFDRINFSGDSYSASIFVFNEDKRGTIIKCG